ncbi:hypothetical protein B0H14DRAFT_2604147 [Mycena olivaceomarginata]|nr:hypothetical protein B0H14DRAFT_2604147 [Mycena olivaceomarginata]
MKGLSTFQASFFDDYWKCFLWDLPFDVDPNPNAPPLPPPQTAEEAFVLLGMNLTKEESARKSKIRWTSKLCLRRDKEELAPRHPNNFQFYMCHDDYRDTINTRYNEEYPDQTEGPPSSQYLERHKEDGEELLSVDPNVQHEVMCRLHAYTGLMLKHYRSDNKQGDPAIQNLEVCRPHLIDKEEDTDGVITSANAGTVDGKDWVQWDVEGYGMTLKTYLKFMHAGYLENQRLANPGGSTQAAFSAASVMQAGPSRVHANAANASETGSVDWTGPTDVAMGDTVANDVVLEWPPLLPLVEDEDDAMINAGVLLPPKAPPANDDRAPPCQQHPPPPATSAPATPAAPAAPSTMSVLASASHPTEAPAPFSGAAASPSVQPTAVSIMGPFNFTPEQVDDDLGSLCIMTDPLRVGILAFGTRGPAGACQSRRSGGRATKRKKGEKNDEEDWDTSGDKGESNDNEEAVDSEEQSPTRGKTKTAAKIHLGGKAKETLKWTEAAKILLDRVGMGPDWGAARGAVVDAGRALEIHDIDKLKTRSHPTKGRPAAVGIWVKNVWKGTPDIGTPEAIEKGWWAWWKEINPESWMVLRCLGQNGLLNVMVCLKWWYCAMETPSEAWRSVVLDVKWVLEKILGGESIEAENRAAPSPVKQGTDVALRCPHLCPAPAPTLAPAPPAGSEDPTGSEDPPSG